MLTHNSRWATSEANKKVMQNNGNMGVEHFIEINSKPLPVLKSFKDRVRDDKRARELKASKISVKIDLSKIGHSLKKITEVKKNKSR